MSKPVLEFLKNEAGEKEGLGDAGIETFRNTPYASCAREAGQNSRDAELKVPVRITFNVMSVTHDQFPSHDRLVSALAACTNEAHQERDIEFFANAAKIAAQSSIPVLEIADYNTKGLIGPPNRPETPFHSLLKSTGVSTKESDTSGGSFGIGKNASFAVSDLQMVFYSTSYTDPDTGNEAFAAQGKVKLVSHIGADGEPRRATGYWGDPEGFNAVTDRTLVPIWMNRSETGTSIFCMGFRESEDWAERMTYSLVSNFFCALHRGDMAFQVGNGKFEINRNTVESLLALPEVQLAAEKSGHKAELEFAGQLYRCLVSDNAEEKVIEIRGLGHMRVRVLAEPGMPRRVGFIRNGMLITDNLRHFGHPLQRFPGSRDFVALVEPCDEEAGKLLKRLENPAHDTFSAERISDPVKRTGAETSMRKLGVTLRELIRAAAGVDHEGAVVLDELSRFFAEARRSEAPPDPKAENDPEKYTYEVPRRKRQSIQLPERESGNEGGRATGGGGGGGGGTSTGPAPGQGSGGTGTVGGREPVILKDVRNLIRLNEAGLPQSRVLHFTPVGGGPIVLSVRATGIDSPQRLPIAATDTGTAKSGDVLMDVEAGQRCSVTVRFGEPYGGPIEVLAVNT